ncbi:MAG: sarcosine oxidase subunit gamma family protein [Alphaproteobacteria bacterium]
MADATILTRRSALEGHYAPGDFGAIKDGAPGITLQERRALAIVHVDAWEDRAADCAKAVGDACGTEPAPGNCKATESGGNAILWVGPNRWLITEKEGRDLFATITAKVTQDLGAVTDQGHSRVCWRVSGPRLRDLLVKGSTIDFDRMVAGDSINSLMSHFSATIHCRAYDSVDIYVARSFAVDFQRWLHESSLEFGLRIGDPI